MLHRAVQILAAAALAVALVGCGGGGCSSSGSGGPGTVLETSRLMLRMTDSPDPAFLAASVTISKIEVNREGAWVLVTDVPQTIDLLDIAINGKVIGDILVPAGSFTQIRIYVSKAAITDATGDHDVKLSSVSNGIKVNLDFVVDLNKTTEILIDFNSHHAIVKETGNTYMLRSVVQAITAADSGTLVGTVFDGTDLVTGALVSAIYESGPNAAPGKVINSAMSGANGEFKIWALDEGTYKVEFTWTDAQNNDLTATVNGVTVTAQNETSVGDVAVQ